MNNAMRKAKKIAITISILLCIAGFAHAQSFPAEFGPDFSELPTIQAPIAFRIIPDIDGDGQAETLTSSVFDGCPIFNIHRSSVSSDGVIDSSTISGSIRLKHSLNPGNDGCGQASYTIDVGGDYNADGLADLLVRIRRFEAEDFEAASNYSAMIYTPSNSDVIDFTTLDASAGYLVRHAELLDAGDMNGDGHDDLLLRSSFFDIVNRVYSGASLHLADETQSDFDIGGDVLLDLQHSGGDMRNGGDFNGDGFDDLLWIGANSNPGTAIIYGDGALSLSIDQASLADYIQVEGCSGNLCSINPVGDIDGDGYDDLTISRFGCGYAYEAAVIYGSDAGIPRFSIPANLDRTAYTRVVDHISGGCLNGILSGTPGDVNGDSLNDLYISLGYREAGALIFGERERPEIVSLDELDGTNGFRVASDDTVDTIIFDEIASEAHKQFNLVQLDINGDGLADLLDAPDDLPRPTDISLEPRRVIYGTNQQLPRNGPQSLVVEQFEDGWLVRWQPPVEGEVDFYSLSVDGAVVATTEPDVLSFTLLRNHSAPFDLRVEARSAMGTIGQTLRRVPAIVNGEVLEAEIYGPSLVELRFNRQGKWLARTVTYQLWRDAEFLTTVLENADSHWDDSAVPGETHTYWLTPRYSAFDSLDTPQALRDWPLLQRRSNSVTVTMPGGNDSDGDSNAGNPDDGDESDQDNNDERIQVEGNTIRWPDDGWYQVQNASIYETLCEGTRFCDVPDGQYIVINHDTGSRYENVTVPDKDEVDAPGGKGARTIEGNTLSWPDNGWYQVQNASTYETICEGTRFCDVPDGQYIVINHNTGSRYENVAVPDGEEVEAPGVLGRLTIEGNSLSWPDDGWYQVQNASTYETICEGTRFCDVPDGQYIVINHKTGNRYENVIVPAI